MFDEEAKAAQEIAKTAGKAVDATREAGGFIARYIGGPLEQAMGMFEDHLKVTRAERRARLMVRMEEINRQHGLPGPTRAILLTLAAPLFQNATLEEDNVLQDRWAALLVNAANANFSTEIRRAYVGILEQLTALDIQILDVLYLSSPEQFWSKGAMTYQLPVSARAPEDLEPDDPTLEPNDDVTLALANLALLGCLRQPTAWGGAGRGTFRRVYATVLGRAFITSCSLPKI